MRGFTLIEVLVVIVIVAVLAAAITISIGTVGGSRQLQQESERFQALMNYACEQAELSGHDIGLSVAQNGYRFSRFEHEDWQPLKEPTLRPRLWLRGMKITLTRESGALDVTNDFPDKPQLVCFSSGELTPFQLNLALTDDDMNYYLIGEADGEVVLSNLKNHAD